MRDLLVDLAPNYLERMPVDDIVAALDELP